MSTNNDSVTWTLKIGQDFDKAIQEAVKLLGYTSKAELTREALREFLIRRKLYYLLDGEPSIPTHHQNSPIKAIEYLIATFKGISKEDIEEETNKARIDVEGELLK